MKMPRHNVYFTNEDEEILNQLCGSKPKSSCVKEIIRNYYQMKKQIEIEKKLDEILMILKSQNNTRQTNAIDTFMKKGK